MRTSRQTCMIKEELISTFEDLKKIILESPECDSDIPKSHLSYLYRGLPNVEFKLESSLRRNCKEKSHELETVILQYFIKFANSEIRNLGLGGAPIWTELALGQHHGLPTRLLDWTPSPAIALHFCTDIESLSQMNDHDGVVWKIDINELNKMLPKKYRKMLKSRSVNFFSADMLDKICPGLEDYDDHMENTSLVLFEPPSVDPRIINQYSYFSIIPEQITDIEEFLDQSTDNTTKYIIDKSLKWELRDWLDKLNICERIIYPDLDGISSLIKRRYYVRG